MSIKSLFQNIADAIKTKDTSVVTVTPAQMPGAILNIPSGGVEVYELTEIPSDDFGNDGDYAIVTLSITYARNNGSNYVDFGIQALNIFGFSLKAQFVSASNNYYLAGTDGDNFCIGKAQNGPENIEYFIRGSRSAIITNTGVFTIRTDEGTVYVNDIAQALTYNPLVSLGSSSNTFSIYSVRGNRTLTADIYEVKLYDNLGNLLIDAKPVLYNNVVCFYDAVSDSHFYPNGGTLTLFDTTEKYLYKKVNGEWVIIM